MSYDEASKVYRALVVGPTRVLEAVLPSLVRGGGGRDEHPFTVVNVSCGLGSISRVMGGDFNTPSMDSVYRSTKAALNMVGLHTGSGAHTRRLFSST